MANPNKFTSKEVLNKVLLDSSGNAVTANSVTTQEALNSVLDTTNNRLNMSLAGGTISGDVTISGDLTVAGSGSAVYDEIIQGSLHIETDDAPSDNSALTANTGGDELVIENSDHAGLSILTPDDKIGNIFFGDVSDTARAGFQYYHEGVDSNERLLFNVAGGEKMRLTSGSQLRIGDATTDTSVDSTTYLKVAKSGTVRMQLNSTNSGVAALHFGDTADVDIGSIEYSNSSNQFDIATNASVAMTIDSSQRVGIGTGANIDELLHVQASSGNVYAKVEAEASNSSAGLRLVGGDNDESRIHFGNSSDVDIGKIVYLHGSTNAMVFTTNTSEKMRIESGGDILIKTADAKIKADSTNTLNIQAHNLKILGSGGEERFHFQSEGNSNPSEFSMKGDTENTMIKLNTNGDSFIHGKSNSAVSFNITSFSTNDGKIPRLRLRHSNNNTVGTDTAVDSGDELGEVAFQGYDGSSEYNTGASISAKAGATFSTSEAQSELIFKVASGSQNPAEKLRLSHDGILFVGGFSGLAAPELAIKSNTTGNGLVNVVSFRDSNNTQQAYLGYGSSSHSNLNLLNLLGGLNFYAGSANIRFALDDNSRISLSNNDSGSNNTVFGYNAGTSLVSGANNNTFIGHNVGDATLTDGADDNTGIGYNALTAHTSGNSNVAIGSGAMEANTTGNSNVAIGKNALQDQTAGGNNNVCVGVFAGGNMNDVSCDDNVLVGKEAGLGNVDSCVAIGKSALAGTGTNAPSNSLGTVAIGNSSCMALTTASGSTAVGYQAGKALTTGSNNTAVGYQALLGADDSQGNVAIGHLAMGIGNPANNNVAIGASALEDTTGASNIAIGYRAGRDVLGVNDNVLIGHNAGLSMTDTADTVLIGRDAGKTINHSDANGTVCVGKNAGELITEGQFSTLIGFNSGMAITTADGSTSLGYETLKALTTGVDNVAIGERALDEILTGCCNIAIGTNALGNCDGAENENIAIGNNAGLNLDGGSNNTIVGANANASVGNASGQIVLGKDVTGAGNNNATLGISTNKVSIDLDGSDTSWAASSDERSKENIQASTAGLSFINELRPVTFNWKKAKDVDKSMSQYQDSEEPVLGAEGSYGKTMHGFIAQEVKSAIDKHSDLKEGFSMWKEWEDGTQAVSDGALVPMLVKAIQELSARVEELESK